MATKPTRKKAQRTRKTKGNGATTRAQIHIYTSHRLKSEISNSRFRADFSRALGAQLSLSQFMEAICNKVLEAERRNPDATWNEVWDRVITPATPKKKRKRTS